jgi:hypothetical protein
MPPPNPIPGLHAVPPGLHAAPPGPGQQLQWPRCTIL